MRRHLRLSRLSIIVLAVLWSGSAAADFADGVQAFDGGNLAEAVRAWREAAAAGDADAQVALAGLYEDGIGVQRDLERAVELYRRAACQGHPTGALNLGLRYARGEGLPQDRVKAYLWLGRAADTGHAWAVVQRDALAAEMSGAALSRARDLPRTPPAECASC